jgi:hypothetical protein
MDPAVKPAPVAPLDQSYPDKYWHCHLEVERADGLCIRAFIMDAAFAELNEQVIVPWHSNTPIFADGRVLSPSQLTLIRVVRTEHPLQYYLEQMRHILSVGSVFTALCDGKLAALLNGEDCTGKLLAMQPQAQGLATPGLDLVLTICKRFENAAGLLRSRRENHDPYLINDEYDAHDLLHCIIRATTPFTITEDPIGKVANVKSGRADISIESIGVILELKYAREGDDRRLIDAFGADLVYYAKWEPLKHFIYMIVNSRALRDRESFTELAKPAGALGKPFDVAVVLS